MIIRRSTTAVLAGLLAAAIATAAGAQQAGPPPAVLVQAVEAKPLSEQLEFIGRAAAVSAQQDLISGAKSVENHFGTLGDAAGTGCHQVLEQADVLV